MHELFISTSSTQAFSTCGRPLHADLRRVCRPPARIQVIRLFIRIVIEHLSWLLFSGTMDNNLELLHKILAYYLDGLETWGRKRVI